MQYLADPLTFKVNFTAEQIRQAEAAQTQQTDASKARQIYLNMLAVQAVSFYCECIGVETDFAASDSWDAAMQTLIDVADLEVIGQGKLECRPLLANDESCYVPPEALADRIGYVVVKINETPLTAELLGFSQTAVGGQITLNELQSLEDLIDVLIEESPQFELIDALGESLVEFGSWLRNIFDETWLSPELVLATAYRGLSPVLSGEAQPTVRKAKRLGLGSKSLVLVLEATPITPTELEILLKIHPFEDSILPLGLRMELLDDLESVAMQTQAGSSDNFRALNFQIPTHEFFKVRLSLGEDSLTEDFSSSQAAS
ncbi:MAG: DUF1822 family protein [Cyanobacteria bacterium J06639_16]